MRNRTYWKKHYVVCGDADEIERNIKQATFVSGRRSFELIHFEKGKDAPNILISQGSGGHAYVFAQLGYEMHMKGYNVFIMPKHGGYTITELIPRHQDALNYIRRNFNDRIGVFAEGLGGYVVFYMALAHSPVKSMALQNAPAIVTEEGFQRAIMEGTGTARRRKLIMPFAKLLVKIVPDMPVPIALYLDFRALIDTKDENRLVEKQLVEDGYLKDPDFDTWYPLSAVVSLLTTPPPNPLTELRIPTMFMIAIRGFGDGPFVKYLKDLYSRLPAKHKKLIEIDGSVYWMLSHPKEAAKVICEWFNETV